MSVFPTLSRSPIYPLDEHPEDDVIRDQSEAGYETTRPRFTRVRWVWPSIKYEGMSQADKDTLDAFYIANRASIFQWTHPKTGLAKNVRFSSYKTPYPNFSGYDFEFGLKEA